MRRQDKNDDWKQITYLVYDAPLLKMKFKERLVEMEKCLKGKNEKIVKLHKQEICKDQAHLDKEMDEVLAKQGEGLMIKNPDSMYESKRSCNLLKVKKFLDTEATVLKHLNGTGRCSAMCGAILCKLDNGIEFKIGSGFDDKQRRNPPKLGSRVTFKYQGLSNSGKPRFPIFMREHPGM